MAGRSLEIIVNVQGGTLVSSFTSTVQGQLPAFIFGDSTPVSVRLVEPSGIDARPWRELDLTDQTVRIGIGVPGSAPSAGTFTLTYGGDTTAALAYNASAAQVAAALNALASIISAGGVTVTASGATYKVVFDDVGVRTALTADVASISPTSGAYISTVMEGSVSAQAIYLFRLEAMPASYVELADELPVAAVVVATVREGATGVSDIQTFTLSPVPYDGTYTLTVDADETVSLPWDSDAAAIQTALEELAGVGAGNVSVSGEFPSFVVTFAASLGNVDEIVGDASALIVPTGRSGILSNNTTGVAELLASRSRVDATLEVELVDDITGDTWTPLQVACTLREDVIPGAPSSQTGGPVYLLESIADARYMPIGQVKSANFTAANDTTYHVVSTATVTDPSPVEGKGFTVFVRNGTATVGGVEYSRAGTLVMRTFHSGAWSNVPFYSPVTVDDIPTLSDNTAALSVSTLTANTSIETTNTGATITTSGQSAFISTSGISSGIFTNGLGSSIYTAGNGSSIYTTGSGSAIYTAGGGVIQTSSTFKIYDGTNTTTISGTQTQDISIALPDASGTVALIPTGPYADDAAAATGGVPVGFLYYTAAGDVKIRLT